jgi:hypothetical protein
MKGRDFRDASMKLLKRRRGEEIDSDSNGDYFVESKARMRRLSSKFVDSFDSWKDGRLSSMGGRNELREREIKLETKRLNLEEKRLAINIVAPPELPLK